MRKRWVIKLGSGLLTRPDGRIDRARVSDLVGQIASLKRKGIEVILVTSGAIAAGMTAMGLKTRPRTTRELQACATVGQPELMAEYGRHLRRRGLIGAQLLLTYGDIDSRTRSRNARATLVHLLAYGMPALDSIGRPTQFFSRTVHEQCPRFRDYELEIFAKNFGDPGCLFKLGCLGPNTHADCTLRGWNGTSCSSS
jgi:hypothetical protein